MTIYSLRGYRRIYENTYGPIPKDQFGRTYEIHHRDGNRRNNDPTNLVALSMQEHYDVHLAQHDWASCLRLSERMKVPAAEVSRLASLSNQKRVANGTCPFLGGEVQRKLNQRRLTDGTHHFLGNKNPSIQRVLQGTHHLLKRPDGSSVCGDNVKNGSHPTQKLWKCPHCNLEGKNAAAGKRWHFDNCRNKPD